MAPATGPLARMASAPAGAARLYPRRINKQLARASPREKLQRITELYHLAPTFLPNDDPQQLSKHITQTLTPVNASQCRPRPQYLRDIIIAHADVDKKRVQLELGGRKTTSLTSVEVNYPTNFYAAHNISSDAKFDPRKSFYNSYILGQEPPLARRLRQVTDALHGTVAGGRAGPITVEEQGEKAKQWRDGLASARQALEEEERAIAAAKEAQREEARRQERLRQEEAEAFAKAFETEEPQRS
ncbi:hypothetical protein NBRC10512_004057 [Rhodotorula toruloides]|uniref:RHTO0S03e08042g1_1 n=2 Tax=Rhodotorula toruloides TaxID=5286 RepID=A0A061AMC4_RHOTO|nr:uncharacterized protein RHTO_00389 [Rhodotorula toruloides NP11]EMS25961.1 hypothetical protein RHTO_00389 [Rhodotorula toruloides NP11]KAJ8295863.1 hypothetical protein OF846_001207 [Rhodotorula toruloides]CDR38305.1 RHTO0S03e08042g1_1 [Rhodotorula toruloides]